MPYPIKVNCINCDSENLFEFDVLSRLSFVRCKKCNENFNLFGVYNSLYSTIPLCKKMVDVAVDYCYAQYSIEASLPQEKGKIERVLKENDFSELVRKLLYDMVLYGNSFVHMTSDSHKFNLNRLEPRELQFKIDWVQEPPFKSYGQKIVDIRRHDNPSVNYDVKDCLHFKGGLGSTEPVGDSILGLWFGTWYFLRDIPEAVPLLDLQGSQYSDLKWFRDFKESNVLGAAGIPHNLIFPWLQIQPRVLKIEQQRFQHDNERRRDEISWLLEHKAFPRIIGRDYQYDNFPRLVFHAIP